MRLLALIALVASANAAAKCYESVAGAAATEVAGDTCGAAGALAACTVLNCGTTTPAVSVIAPQKDYQWYDTAAAAPAQSAWDVCPAYVKATSLDAACDKLSICLASMAAGAKATAALTGTAKTAAADLACSARLTAVGTLGGCSAFATKLWECGTAATKADPTDIATPAAGAWGGTCTAAGMTKSNKFKACTKFGTDHPAPTVTTPAPGGSADASPAAALGAAIAGIALLL